MGASLTVGCGGGDSSDTSDGADSGDRNPETGGADGGETGGETGTGGMDGMDLPPTDPPSEGFEAGFEVRDISPTAASP